MQLSVKSLGISAKSARRAAFLAVGVALLATGCAQLGQRERELVFRVQPGTAPWFDGMPEGIQEVAIAVPVGGKLDAWWWPAANPRAPALLYLHGARWNLTGQLFRIQQLHDFGFSVLAIDYRGFGKSEGALPSEATVYQDAHAAWSKLAELQPDPGRRFIYGHSLGGAVAVDLAASLAQASDSGDALPARGLIIESSFTNLVEMARSLTWAYLPVGLLLSEKFDSESKIAAVRMPVLLVHGTGDRFVPARFSQALYDKVQSAKKLLLVQGANHNNSMRLGSDEYLKALHELFGLDFKPLTQALQ